MTMNDADLDHILDELKRYRDEARVRIHLGKADAKDEWERLEHAWAQLRAKMGTAGRELGKTAADVGAALRLAAEELRDGYHRIRNSI